jgi:hypothetical protein
MYDGELALMLHILKTEEARRLTRGGLPRRSSRSFTERFSAIWRRLARALAESRIVSPDPVDEVWPRLRNYPYSHDHL